MVRKMKAIYYTLNLFNVDVTKKCFIGECWIPVSDLETVRNTLNESSVRFNHSLLYDISSDDFSAPVEIPSTPF